jgi:heme A synthase
VDVIFSVITVDTFWKILLFIHFLLAVALLAAVTLQTAAVLMPAQDVMGSTIIDRSPVPARSYATLVVVLYVLQALLGAWIYVKYRTYVRIPMEELRHWWTVGAFEFKEHMVAMGLGLLPAYWYFWREPAARLSSIRHWTTGFPARWQRRSIPRIQHYDIRRWVTVFLALSVWYAFIVGHVANDFRGVGS